MHFLLLLFGEVRSASNWAPLCWFCSGEVRSASYRAPLCWFCSGEVRPASYWAPLCWFCSGEVRCVGVTIRNEMRDPSLPQVWPKYSDPEAKEEAARLFQLAELIVDVCCKACSMPSLFHCLVEFALLPPRSARARYGVASPWAPAHFPGAVLLNRSG